MTKIDKLFEGALREVAKAKPHICRAGICWPLGTERPANYDYGHAKPPVDLGSKNPGWKMLHREVTDFLKKRPYNCVGLCARFAFDLMMILREKGITTELVKGLGQVFKRSRMADPYSYDESFINHYVVRVGNLVADPAGRQFSPDWPKVYSFKQFQRDWDDVVEPDEDDFTSTEMEYLQKIQPSLSIKIKRHAEAKQEALKLATGNR